MKNKITLSSSSHTLSFQDRKKTSPTYIAYLIRSKYRSILKMSVFLLLLLCTYLANAQVPNTKAFPFQHGDLLYYLIAEISLPDTIRLKMSVSPDYVHGSGKKIVGLDETIFTSEAKTMFNALTPAPATGLTPENILSLYSRMKAFREEFANAIDEFNMPDSIQQKINALLLQINKTNRDIEHSYMEIKRLKIEKRFVWRHHGVGELVDSAKTKLSERLKKLALTTVFDRSSLKREITKNKLIQRKQIAKRSAIASKVIDCKSHYAVPSLYLTGNALSYLENKEPTTTTGIGLYSRKADLWEFSMYMTISQSKDIVTANTDDREIFGNALLIPGVRKYSLLTSYRLYSLWPYSISRIKQMTGFGWNINLTPMTWQLTEPNTDNIIHTSSVIPFSSDLYFSINWLQSKSKTREIGKEFRVSTDFGLTCRQLFGDLTQKSDWINDFLGQRNRFYPGFYFGINATIDNLVIYFNGPILMGAKVEGLTYGQTIANIGIRGKLFGISDSDNKKNNTAKN